MDFRSALLFSVLVLYGASHGTAHAQGVAEAEPWTDARVRQVALARAPSVRRAQSELNVARSMRAFGSRPPIGNPTVGVMAIPGVPDYGAWTMAASIGIPIEVSGYRSAWGREAEREVRASEARLASTVLEAVTRARQARLAVAIARATVEIQAARLETAREAEARVRARLTAGADTDVVLALAERERAEAEADLASAREREVRAVASFRRAIDLDHDAEVRVAPWDRPPPVSPDELAMAVARAPRQRQDVAALDLTAARLDASESRIARSTVAPLVIGLEGQQVATGPQTLEASVGASLRWELPIVQRAQGERAMVRAEASGNRVRASLLRREVGREVSEAAQALTQILTELDALERSATPAAERLVRVTEAAFAAGSLDFFRVLVARRELLELRARTLRTVESAWGARFEYERAVGDAL